MSEQLCKCDRCGDIKPLFQYTKFETKLVTIKKICGKEGCTHTGHVQQEDIGEKRGLCKECAVEVNKTKYDAKSTGHSVNADGYCNLGCC